MKPRKSADRKIVGGNKTMVDLNDLAYLKKLDPQDTIGSTELLPEQFKVAWKEINNLTLPKLFEIKNLIFCGMGASIYGGLVVRALLGSDFPYPVEVVSDYHLPKFADSSTLVVLTSYSGTTEEVLSCAQEGLAKKTKMVILTKGGLLAEFARQNKVPSYIFDGKMNPSGVPRLGNGYSILGLIGLLYRTGVISVNEKLIERAIEFLPTRLKDLRESAKEDAIALRGKTPIVIAAEHLAGNAQIMRNQFNETSKAFSSYFLVPDLNHHLMEGLKFPVPTNLVFLLLNSKQYSSKISKRMTITNEVVKQNNHSTMFFEATGSNRYEDFMEVALYSSFVTLYLGLLYKQNPAINPYVDYFKKELAR